MSMPTTALTFLLTTLDAALDATGAPFLELSNAGCTDTQIGAALDAAGLGPAPVELYEWFRWHDGSREAPGRWALELGGTCTREWTGRTFGVTHNKHNDEA